jgi:ribosomal protein S18 acetylase RimI-like enzyme
MVQDHSVEVRIVASWDPDEIIALYRLMGWWQEYAQPSEISPLIAGSLAFAVAVERSTGRAVGMGRVISDGVSDAYIQDLVLMPEFRRRGIGKRILTTLLDRCKSAGITWIGLIAEENATEFYILQGFCRMPESVPMLYREDLLHDR